MDEEPYTFPTHCASCGALLMGGATQHAEDCPLWRIIRGLLDEADPLREEESGEHQ